jgi:hypothetical protein
VSMKKTGIGSQAGAQWGATLERCLLFLSGRCFCYCGDIEDNRSEMQEMFTIHFTTVHSTITPTHQWSTCRNKRISVSGGDRRIPSTR